jgi:Ca-activated chloride channel family protein
MDEKELKDLLSSINPPEHAHEWKKASINKAMEAFDQNPAVSAQGHAGQHRLTDKSSNNFVRRFLMKNRFLSGPTGAVAVCALMAVLGTPFIYSQMNAISKNPVNVSTLGGGTEGLKVIPGTDNADEDYKRMVQKQNVQQAQQAAQTGTSAMPTPVDAGERNTLDLPAAQGGSAGDPLAEWRQKTEAKHLAVEQAPAAAPAEADAEYGAPAKKESKVRVDELAKNKAFVGGKDDGRARGELGASADRAVMATSEAEAVSRRMPATSTPAGAPAIIALPRPEPVPVSPPVEEKVADYYQEQGRDKFVDFEENNVKSVTAEPVSTFSIDVDTASYSFVRKMINQGQLPAPSAVRLEEMINYFDYNYALPAKDEDPFRPTVAVYPSPWKEGNKLVHIGIKGYDLEEKPKSNLVFLIDTSGSMNSPDKLPLVISSFKLMLDNMKADDTISIVTYAGSAGVALEPTKVSEKSKIINALERLSSGGSTAGAEGIRTAYNLAEQGMIKDGNNRVILATDGDFNVGISDPNKLKDFIEKKRDKGIFLSVLGFGQGNYQDATMQALAQNGNGNAAYIDNLSEARKVLVQEAGSTLFTIAKDVKIQVEFNPTQVMEYRLLGYETRHLNREDFNNDRIDAGEVGAGHAVTAIYEITPVGATPMVDNLRYGEKADKVAVKAPEGMSDEYAFLKIRYKKPDGDTSKLLTRPITKEDETSFDKLSDDLRFASSVAGFGQLLRNSKFIGNLSYDKVIEMANGARGKDEYGYRTEFVNLVRLAKSAAGNDKGRE